MQAKFQQETKQTSLSYSVSLCLQGPGQKKLTVVKW